MALQASSSKKVFKFNFKARTSRGPMQDKTSWFIKIWDEKYPQIVGIGECGPLPGLSSDDIPDFEDFLAETIQKIPSLRNVGTFPNLSLHEIIPSGFSSITFGVETALLDLYNGGKRIIFENDFVSGMPIPINGLIWMGEREFMIRQIDQKIAQGFKCIKLKVGGLDFEQECEVLSYVRKRYSGEYLTIRLDANGAFKEDAISRLQALEKFDVHSIEQPIPPNLPQMEELCRISPVPIALDEELIGKETRDAKVKLLTRLRPQFIILKPTLHGGLSGCAEWIEVAKHLRIDWWITSALESNIGLNAICQFAANYQLSIPQGLGTGTIYTHNIDSPLAIGEGKIFMVSGRRWNITDL